MLCLRKLPTRFWRWERVPEFRKACDTRTSAELAELRGTTQRQEKTAFFRAIPARFRVNNPVAGSSRRRSERTQVSESAEYKTTGRRSRWMPCPLPVSR